MTYADRLLDPRWQKRRLEIYQRDNWTCTNKDCGNTTIQLHVHHLEYLPGILPWEYPDDMLKTLCHYCHEKEVGRLKIERGLLTALKQKSFLCDDLSAMEAMLYTDSHFVVLIKSIIDKFKRK